MAGRGRGLRRALARQILWSLTTLLALSLVTFVAVNASRPAEDVARKALGRLAPQKAVEAYVERNGLNAPLPIRYVRWLASLARGNPGASITTGRQVGPEVLARAQKSLTLALVSLAIALPAALWLGLFMARHPGSTMDAASTFGLLVLSALPEFVIGFGLLMLLGVAMGLFPTDSSGLVFGGVMAQAESYVLPALTLALVSISYLAWITRAAARDALAAPYTRAATLRGLTRRSVLWDHAMRNAAVPIVNAVAINFVYLLGGVIVVENVFAFPGLGQALVAAIDQGDVVTVQAIALVMGAMFVGTSFIADVAVIYLNPRLRGDVA